MNSPTNNIQQKQLYYRIISLWVIIEAFAGGIMHGIKIPFSGLVISGLAMLCIMLIAFHISDKKAIIKATLIVAVFKFMLSPHSPGTAYIALFFQGCMGQLLFINKKYFSIAAILFGFLGAVESAIQRLLVLLIVYGNEFWEAFNQFIHKITGDKTLNNYSFILAALYVLTHAIAGILIGIYGANIAKKSMTWKNENADLIFNCEDYMNVEIGRVKTTKSKKYKAIFLSCWLILMLFYFYPTLFSKESIIPSNQIVRIFIRSILIISTWLFVISPLLFKFIQKALAHNQLKYNEIIIAITDLLPKTKAVFIGSWKISAQKKGTKRWKLFLRILIVNTI